jgi:putative transposase
MNPIGVKSLSNKSPGVEIRLQLFNVTVKTDIQPEGGATMENPTNRNSWEVPEILMDIFLEVIPGKKSNMGRPVEVDFRKILAGIFFVMRTGIQWRACPREEYGPPSTVYHYFSKWCREGIFAAMAVRALEFHDALWGIDWKWQSVDGAMTKAPLGGEATGPNPTDRGKLGTKRSLLVDGRGVPLSVVPAGANVNDFKILEKTIRSIRIDRPEPSDDAPQNLCLDKGYDNRQSRRVAIDEGYVAHIRSRGEEKREKTAHTDYKARRWVVEVAHSWFNRFRKILVRFEKKAETHLGLLHFACAYIALNRAGTF